jgi:hypothetical protein
MGKYKASATDNAPAEPQQPTNVCCECQWDFVHDNERRHPMPDKPGRSRREPRTAIRHGRDKLICDVCHDKALMQQGRHSMLGVPVAERMHRDALWPDQAERPTGKKKRQPTAAELERFAARFGSDA